MSIIFLHIMTCFFLPIGLNEITKILQMWLNNPQCGCKEGEKFPIFWWARQVLPYASGTKSAPHISAHLLMSSYGHSYLLIRGQSPIILLLLQRAFMCDKKLIFHSICANMPLGAHISTFIVCVIPCESTEKNMNFFVLIFWP